MGEKGQISLFIIVGIAVLLLIGISAVALRTTTQDPIETSTQAEALPFQVFLEECMENAAIEGLHKIGATGGYLDIDQQSFLIIPTFPTYGDGFNFAGQDIAYWQYTNDNIECTQCQFLSQQPPLEGSPSSIERQLARYTEDAIATCVENSVFEQQGYTVEVQQDPFVEFEFTETNTIATAIYPIKLTTSDSEQIVQEYSTIIDIPFAAIYEHAALLARSQQNFNYLELFTQHILALYQGTDDDDLPIQSAIELEFGPGTIWSEFEVQQRVDDIISTNIGLLQVQGSNNFEPNLGQRVDTNLPNQIQGILNGTVIPLDEPSNFDVNFEYLGGGLEFNTNDNGIIRPTSMSMVLSLFGIGINRYNTVYDISYPVKVTVEDPEALRGNGYEFSFGLETNMRDNNPPGWVISIKDDSNNRQFCDPRFFTAGPLRVTAQNGYTQEPLEDAIVTYDCGFAACTLGVTDENGKFVSNIPVCAGGEAGVFMESTSRHGEQVNGIINQSVNITAELFPTVTRKLDFEWNKYNKFNGDWEYSGLFGLGLNEMMLVLVKNVDTEATQIFEVDNANIDNLQVQLSPGNYQIMVQVLYNSEEDPVIYEPVSISTGGGGLFGGSQTVRVPETTQNISTIFLGGATFDDTTRTFTVDQRYLESFTTLVVPLTVFNIPGAAEKRIEDVGVSSRMLDIQEARQLTPYWE